MNGHEDYNAIQEDVPNHCLNNKLELSKNEVHPRSNRATPHVLSVEDAIERLGYGPFQRSILVAAGFCFAADSMEILMLSFLSAVLQAEWDLSENQTASITASVFVGATVGTLVLGPLGDQIGRRPTFLLAASLICLFGMATAFAQSYTALLSIRFMVGFGVGGLTVPFDTLAEFLPTRKRGKNLLYIEYFWTGGTLLVPPLAYLTLGHSSKEGSWQMFCFVCALPCFIGSILGYLYVPESPRWLCARNRPEEALTILREAAIRNKHADPYHLFPKGTQLAAEYQAHSSFADLLGKKWRSLTLALWGTWGGFAFGYYGTILAISKVFAASSSDGSSNNTDYDFDYAAIFQSGAGEVLGTTLVLLTIDRFGRIPSQITSYAMGGICVFLLCIFANGNAPPNVLILLAFLARTFEMSASCVTWVSTAEILTTDIRASGHSAANAVARIGAFMCPYFIMESTSLVAIGIVMVLVHMFTICCTSFLPETKGVAMGAAMTNAQIQGPGVIYAPHKGVRLV